MPRACCFSLLLLATLPIATGVADDVGPKERPALADLVGASEDQKVEDAQRLLGKLAEEHRSRYAQKIADVRRKIVLARMLSSEGKPKEAFESLKKAEQLVEQLPPGKDAEELRQQVDVAIAKVRSPGRKSEARRATDSAKKARKAAERLKEAERSAQQAEIARLLRQAEADREAGRDDAALRACEAALALDPEDQDAERLKDDIQRRRLKSAARHARRRREENTHLLMASIAEARIPPDKLIVYPDDWEDIKRRAAKQRAARRLLADEEIPANVIGGLQSPVSFDFRDTPLEDVLAFLRQGSGVNIVLDHRALGALDDARAPVTLRVNGMRTSDALAWALNLVGLEHKYSDGAIIVSTRDRVRGEPLTRDYDVVSLLAIPRDFPSRLSPYRPWQKASARAASETGRGYQERLGGEGEELAAFIRRVVEPDTWRDEMGRGQNTVIYRNGRLIVTQTPDIHMQIQDLLDRLREARVKLVSVSARFIDINNDMIETLGIDFRGLDRAPLTGAALGDPSTGWFSERGRDQDIRVRVAHSLETAAGLRMGTSEGFNLQWTILGDTQVEFILDAVIKHAKGNILTSPRITCFDGQRANLTVMDTITYISSISASGDMQTATASDGISFDVRPTASPDNKYITMTVRPSIQDLVELNTFEYTLTSGDSDDGGVTSRRVIVQTPRVAVRMVQCTVTIPNGGSLLIGGLARAREVELFSSLPFIEKIPILNLIFSRKGRGDERDNLLILITGKIIVPGEED